MNPFQFVKHRGGSESHSVPILKKLVDDTGSHGEKLRVRRPGDADPCISHFESHRNIKLFADGLWERVSLRHEVERRANPSSFSAPASRRHRLTPRSFSTSCVRTKANRLPLGQPLHFSGASTDRRMDGPASPDAFGAG